MIVILMGVSGSGKTAVGRALAARLGCPFCDADDYHPPENVAKMARGVPLNDDDRMPWLIRLHEVLADHWRRGETVVLACSALKRRYRDVLRADIEPVQFVHLRGSFDLISKRMRLRADHYMKPNMLRSQFEDLEPPGADEALTINITESLEAAVRDILEYLERRGYSTDPPVSPRSGGGT